MVSRREGRILRRDVRISRKKWNSGSKGGR
jgi:hypothetical protein